MHIDTAKRSVISMRTVLNFTSPYAAVESVEGRPEMADMSKPGSQSSIVCPAKGCSRPRQPLAYQLRQQAADSIKHLCSNVPLLRMSLFFDPSCSTCRDHTTETASGILCQSMHHSSPCEKLSMEML
jgi:hypothetical protein